MKKIVKFKKNIFEKKIINSWTEPQNISSNLSSIKNLKNNLISINNEFGEYSSREIWLIHNESLPPKTKRCTDVILELDKANSLSTYLFDDFEDEVNIKLITVINIKKNSLNNQIAKVTNIIELLQNILKKNSDDLNILFKKTQEYPEWLILEMKNRNIKKTWLIKFLNDIQSNFKKLFIPKSELHLEGDLIANFSSKQTLEEFIKFNNIQTQEYEISLNDEKTIFINSSQIIDPTNIKAVYKNRRISSLPEILDNKIDSSSFDFPDLENNLPTIGILDSAIPRDSIFANKIKITSLLKHKKVIDHGEAVSSIAMFGDKLNNFEDGCGLFNIELFEIFEEGINVVELASRIRKAISSSFKKIKVWNLSINAIMDDALENGEPTWLAAELDEIQSTYDVIIVQSAGNLNNNPSVSKKIKSPSESINSLVVSSINNFDKDIPSSYALYGYGLFATRKPDVSFFGGEEKNKVKVLKNGEITFTMGTSFSAPFVARKIAYLIYYESFSILEAKALIIHSAFVGSKGDKIDEKIGWGIVPKNIKDILTTKNHEIRFIFNEKIQSTYSNFLKLKIPEEDEQEYSTYLTYLSSDNLDRKYGCEYIRSAINLSYGPLKEGSISSTRKVKPHKASNQYEEALNTEKQLIKVYGKWKTTFCGKDILKRKRISFDEGYGINAKFDKRMNLIKDMFIQDVVCIVTIKHKNKVDKYEEFINKNKLFIDIYVEEEIVYDGDLEVNLN